MAQGPLKKIKPSTAKRYVIFQSPHNHKKSNSHLADYMIRPTALAPKRGPRQIAPKKATLIKQQKITKKLTAGLTAKTERSLAQRAGHLELLAGGKKDKKAEKEKGKEKGGKKN
ncbi:conserved hypothetical protein [Aspergillus udagawae]|uniref:Uncharacterized protein n=1 Tax=Aspergillus udagawae TaxID=91492 RepID=A0A8H3N976_9EURO|nr:conserved hypothetical protein [Aspergillus udagawae]